MGHEDPQPLAARLGWLGLASAALDLGSVYWKTPAIRAGLTVGDLIDAVTPVFLVLLYALVLRGLGTAGRGGRLLFALGGFGLLLGHGIHVAANSIDDAIARAGATDPLGLVNFWDEHVSHYLIHGSKALLCVGLTAAESRGAPSSARRGAGILLAGALAYGFITFAEGVEGQTVPLVLPFVVLYFAYALGRGRPIAPVRRFYAIAAAVSILLFATWGIAHRGFPEFSHVGLIPQPQPTGGMTR